MMPVNFGLISVVQICQQTAKNFLEYKTKVLKKGCAHHWGHCFLPRSSLQEFNISLKFQRDRISPAPPLEESLGQTCCLVLLSHLQNLLLQAAKKHTEL